MGECGPVRDRGKVRDRPLVAGGEDDQVRVEAVRDPRPLADPLISRVHEELHVLGDARHRDRAQALFSERHPSDHEGVARVALARPAQVPALAIGEDRGYPDDLLTCGNEQPRQGCAERP